MKLSFCLVASDVTAQGTLVGVSASETFAGRENGIIQIYQGAHMANLDFQLSNVGVSS